MKQITVSLSKEAGSKRGSGKITWPMLQAMMRVSGVLMEGQHVEKLEVTKEGITFTTSKTGFKR